MRFNRSITALLGLAVTLGCTPADQTTESLDLEEARRERAAMSPELAGQIDSGNVAFRADDFSLALTHFERAIELDDESAPAWFGVYMTQRALGDSAAAAEALARTRGLAPGATILHSTDEDTIR